MVCVKWIRAYTDCMTYRLSQQVSIHVVEDRPMFSKVIVDVR